MEDQRCTLNDNRGIIPAEVAGAVLDGSLAAMPSWPAGIAPENIFAEDYAEYNSASKNVRKIRKKMEQNNRDLQAATNPDVAEEIVAEMKRQDEAYTDAVNQCSQAVSSAMKRKKEKKKFKTCDNDTPLKAGLKCRHGFVYQRGKCRTKVRSGCKEYYWKAVEVSPE